MRKNGLQLIGMFDRYLTCMKHKPTTNLCDMKDKHEEYEEYDLMVYHIDGRAINVLRGEHFLEIKKKINQTKMAHKPSTKIHANYKRSVQRNQI